MTYIDQLVRAIRHKFAPDLMTALRDCDQMGFDRRTKSVRVPLRADIRVLYEKDLAAFVVRGSVHHAGKDQFEHWEGVFASETIGKATDRAAAVEYLFDSAKAAFLRSMAEGELATLLKDKQP